ncbi:MAG TPA: cupin domain-containing protein [Methylomirabilota bacterium]|jgi:mannose-6-phosphate isomerase-like protein (cupin superfamily)|nr:cupin domain-containing protein [Methylomirabilota bacterium]
MRRIFTKKDSERREAKDGHPRSVHIMVEPATAGSAHLAMGLEAVDPGSQIPVHVHAEAEEILFVYRGRGRARVGEREVEVGPETAIFVPKGTPHGFVNTSGGHVHLTWTFAPPGEHEKFRREDHWKHAARAEAPKRDD